MPSKDISRPMVDWAFDELRYKATLYEDTGAVVIYTGHVVKSDTVVPESLKLELQAGVAELENVPNRHKDWHPGYNGQVLHLVDPSLFPIVFGRTRVLETGRTSLEDCIARCGEGQITQLLSGEETVAERFVNSTDHWYDNPNNPYSRVFQLLPCTVDISGEHAKYVDNLGYKNANNSYHFLPLGSRVTSTTFIQ